MDFLTEINAPGLVKYDYVDHEYHIFYDETKPAAIYGGSWTEIGAGTFLMAAGSNGSTGVTGGSANAVLVSHNHRLTSRNTGWVLSDYTGLGGFSDVGNSVRFDGGWTLVYASDHPSGSYWRTTDDGQSGVNANLPPYVTVHIWRRTA